MAHEALKQAEMEAANARHRVEELRAAKQAARDKRAVEMPAESEKSIQKDAALQLALGIKRSAKHVSPSEISGTSSTRTPTEAEVALPMDKTDGKEVAPPMDETRINTSTQKAAWNRLDRLLKSKRGADFPHMVAMFQGKQTAAWFKHV